MGKGGGWWGDTPMHVVKPYVVTYAVFRLYHPPSRSKNDRCSPICDGMKTKNRIFDNSGELHSHQKMRRARAVATPAQAAEAEAATTTEGMETRRETNSASSSEAEAEASNQNTGR